VSPSGSPYTVCKPLHISYDVSTANWQKAKMAKQGKHLSKPSRKPAHAQSNVGPLFWKMYTSSVGGMALNSLPRRSSGNGRSEKLGDGAGIR
jgi:hypothetical protein